MRIIYTNITDVVLMKYVFLGTYV